MPEATIPLLYVMISASNLQSRLLAYNEPRKEGRIVTLFESPVCGNKPNA